MPPWPAVQTGIVNLWIFRLSGKLKYWVKPKFMGNNAQMEMITWLSKNLIKLI